MGTGFLVQRGDSGANLNFRVLGDTSAPSNPKENDIWVNTEHKITSYIFSATKPATQANGMVWISIGASSTVEFNALKKNGIQVYPISAKQYVSGAWVNKTAKSWQGGTWVAWILDSEFVKSGILNPTKGLNGQLRSGQSISITQASGYVEIKSTTNVSGGVAHEESVNVTNYSKLTLYCNVINPGTDFGIVLTDGLNFNSADALNKGKVASKLTSTAGVQTLELPLSGYSGYYYVGILMNNTTGKFCNVYVYDFYLS